MGRLRQDGLQIVRYSPAEQQAFSRLGVYAGSDALIRFGKHPSDYGPWIGDDAVVGNVTQNMAGRGEFCGLSFWLSATRGLPVRPAGLDSEALPNGLGALSYPKMIEYLRHLRAYLYTGTQPASYTLALIEAMLSGIPVASMPADEWWIPDLFEGPSLVGRSAGPGQTAAWLDAWLRDPDLARRDGEVGRQKAIGLFGMETIAPQWQAFLDGSLIEFSNARATVTA